MPRNDRREIRVPNSDGVTWTCTFQQRLLIDAATPGGFAFVEQVLCIGGGPDVTLQLADGEFDRLSDAELLQYIEREVR